MKESENLINELVRQLGHENALIGVIRSEALLIKRKMEYDLNLLNKVLDVDKEKNYVDPYKMHYLRLSLSDKGDDLSVRARWYVRIYKKTSRKRYVCNRFVPLKNNKTLWRDVSTYDLEYWEKEAFLMIEKTLQVLRRKLKKLNIMYQSIESIRDKETNEKILSEKQMNEICRIIKQEGFYEVVSNLLFNQAQKHIRVCEQILEEFFKDREVCLKKQKKTKKNKIPSSPSGDVYAGKQCRSSHPLV